MERVQNKFNWINKHKTDACACGCCAMYKKIIPLFLHNKRFINNNNNEKNKNKFILMTITTNDEKKIPELKKKHSPVYYKTSILDTIINVSEFLNRFFSILWKFIVWKKLFMKALLLEIISSIHFFQTNKQTNCV